MKHFILSIVTLFTCMSVSAMDWEPTDKPYNIHPKHHAPFTPKDIRVIWAQSLLPRISQEDVHRFYNGPLLESLEATKRRQELIRKGAQSLSRNERHGIDPRKVMLPLMLASHVQGARKRNSRNNQIPTADDPGQLQREAFISLITTPESILNRPQKEFGSETEFLGRETPIGGRNTSVDELYGVSNNLG